MDGIIPDKGLVMVFGREGTYKTFAVLDLAMSVANGVAYHGRATAQGAVVYVAAEGGAPLGKRVGAWDEAHDLDTQACFFLMEPVNLDEDCHVAALIEALRNLEATAGRVRLLVFDTFALCRGEDENGSKEMGRTIQALKRLIQAVGCTVLLVHHAPKGTDETHRGSGALSAAMTTNIRVAYEREKVVVECRKQKDAEPFEPIFLKPLSVADSIILEEVNPDANKCKKATKNPTAADVIMQVFAQHGPMERQRAIGLCVDQGLKEKTAYNRIGDLEKTRELVSLEDGRLGLA